MYIKWKYKWFGNKYLFSNSPLELTFWITLLIILILLLVSIINYFTIQNGRFPDLSR
jgi:hypothetical protein